MQQPFASPRLVAGRKPFARPFARPFASSLSGSAALRGSGDALRTAQTILIEWFDLAKQQADDGAATLERMAACGRPTEVWALQTAYLGRAGERALARSFVVADLAVTLVGRMAAAGTTAGSERNR